MEALTNAMAQQIAAAATEFQLSQTGHAPDSVTVVMDQETLVITDDLNQLLADTMTLRDMYKKHHWQASGPTFYPLHLLFDKHFERQLELVDQIAERVQILGGVAVAMAYDVAETTLIPRPPKGREDATTQITRLLHAHEIILEESRAMAREAVKNGDDGTNDLIVSDVIRTNETQVWFLVMHLTK